MVMHPILLKTLNNVIVLFLGVFVLAFLMRGFILPYLRVKASMGLKVLVRIREVNSDLFRVGRIEEGDLIYKYKTKDNLNGERRINNIKTSMFYRMLGVNCIDTDPKTNSIITPDNTIVQGFDAVKQNNLLVRALTRPTILDNKEKVIILLVIVAIIASVAGVIFMAKMYQEVTIIKGIVESSSKVIASKGV